MTTIIHRIFSVNDKRRSCTYDNASTPVEPDGPVPVLHDGRINVRNAGSTSAEARQWTTRTPDAAIVRHVINLVVTIRTLALCERESNNSILSNHKRGLPVPVNV